MALANPLMMVLHGMRNGMFYGAKVRHAWMHSISDAETENAIRARDGPRQNDDRV